MNVSRHAVVETGMTRSPSDGNRYDYSYYSIRPTHAAIGRAYLAPMLQKYRATLAQTGKAGAGIIVKQVKYTHSVPRYAIGKQHDRLTSVLSAGCFGGAFTRPEPASVSNVKPFICQRKERANPLDPYRRRKHKLAPDLSHTKRIAATLTAAMRPALHSL